MSIFDKFRNMTENRGDGIVKPQTSSIGRQKEIFTFSRLPENVVELNQFPESSLDSPFKTAALSVLALCVYGADKDKGIEMLNFLRGPRPLSGAEIAFLDDRFRDGQWYIPFSYFKGTSPENDYTPTEPFTLEIESNPNSAQNEGYMALWIQSSGADIPRQITLRQKGDGRWFLWEQFIMVGIRTPKSKDPWT